MKTSLLDTAALDVARRSNERALDALSLLRVPTTPDQRWQLQLRRYSIAAAIGDLCHERRTGIAAEVHAELMSRGQMPAQPNSLLVPYEILSNRADVAATSAAGGYLIGEQANLPAADALRPRMVIGGLGATIIPAPYGANVSLPKQSGTATAHWLTSETDPVPEVDQVFGQVAFSPHTVGGYTELSRLLLRQAAPTSADAVISRDLGGVVARAIDLAALFGTGAAGQPLGIAGTAGIGTFSAAACSLGSLVNATSALGNALDESAGVATTLAVAGSLRQRVEVAGGTRMLWEGSLLNGLVTGLPARSSTALTAGDIIIGSWAYLNVVTYGALEISVNPFAMAGQQFQKGIVGVRCFATVDTAPTYAAAFTLGTAFT